MPTFDEHYGVWTGKVPNKEGLEKEHGIKTITIDEAKELIKNYKNSVYVFEGEEKAILGIKDLENVEEKRLLLW